jgi:hypothetical protein
MMSWLKKLFSSESNKKQTSMAKPTVGHAFQFPVVTTAARPHSVMAEASRDTDPYALQEFSLPEVNVPSPMANGVYEADVNETISTQNVSLHIEPLDVSSEFESYADNSLDVSVHADSDSFTVSSLGGTDTHGFENTGFKHTRLEDIEPEEPGLFEEITYDPLDASWALPLPEPVQPAAPSQQYDFLSDDTYLPITADAFMDTPPYTPYALEVEPPASSSALFSPPPAEDNFFLPMAFDEEPLIAHQPVELPHNTLVMEQELPSTVELSSYLLEDSLATLEASNQLHGNLVLQDLDIIEQNMPSSIQQSLEAEAVIDLNQALFEAFPQHADKQVASLTAVTSEPELLELFSPLPDALLSTGLPIEALPLAQTAPLVEHAPQYQSPIEAEAGTPYVDFGALDDLSQFLEMPSSQVESLETDAHEIVLMHDEESLPPTPTPTVGLIPSELFKDTDDGQLDATQWFSLDSEKLDSLLGFSTFSAEDDVPTYTLDGFTDEPVESLTQDVPTVYPEVSETSRYQPASFDAFQQQASVLPTPTTEESLPKLEPAAAFTASEAVELQPVQQPLHPIAASHTSAAEHQAFQNKTLPFQDLNLSQIHVLSEVTLPGTRVKVYFIQIPQFYAIISIIHEQCQLLHTFIDNGASVPNQKQFSVQWTATGEQGDLYQLDLGHWVGLVEVNHQNKVTLVDYHQQ